MRRRFEGERLDAADRLAKAIDRSVQLLRGCVFRGAKNGADRVLPGLFGIALLHALLDRGRLRAGDVESAAGQVLGLLGGEWKGRHQDDDPGAPDGPAVAPYKGGKLPCGRAHPAKVRTADLCLCDVSPK